MQQHEAADQVEHRLVKECRVKRLKLLIAREPVGRVNGDCPRHVRGRAVQLLVEKVAPAPDRLSDQQARRHIVHPLEKAQAFDPGKDIEPQRASGDGAKDAKARHLQAEHLARMRRVVLPAGDDVVDTSANDPRKERHDQHIPGDLRVMAIARGQLAD